MRNINIGQMIRERREALGLSQQQLADLVGYKTRGSVSKLETTRDMPIRKVIPVAQALGISVAELVGWTSDEDVPDTDVIAKVMIKSPETFDEFFPNYLKLTDDNKKKVRDFTSFLLSQQPQ